MQHFDNALEKYKTAPVESCDESTRDRIAKDLAGEINKLIPYHCNDDDRLSELLKNGFIPINVIAKQQVDDIVNDLKTKSVYNSHVPYGDGNKRNLSEARKINPFGCYELGDIISCPHILKMSLSEEVLNIAANYLGCTPTIYSINCWWSFPGFGVANTQSYHRDYDDYRFLALFVYLTDVTEKNGAHCYMKYSHTNKLPPQEEVFVGKRGTAFLADTYGVHKSLPLIEGDRLALWIRYGLTRNPPSAAQIREPVSKSTIPDSIYFNNKLNYITRLILKRNDNAINFL